MRITRSRFVFVHLRDDHNARLKSLLTLVPGEAGTRALSPMRAISLPARGTYPVDEADLGLLARTPADTWIDLTALAGTDHGNTDRIARLTRLGLLLTDSDDEQLRELRRREEVLREDGWEPHGALFHFMSQWTRAGLHLPSDARELTTVLASQTAARLQHLAEEHGPLSPAFHHRSDAVGTIDLPSPDAAHESPVLRALSKRRTVREFDALASMTVAELGTVLHHVFGCHGTASTPDDTIVVLKKTSPSGGGLHPTEAYPLVLNVDGLSPGIYHYDVERHGLETLVEMDRPEAQRLANEFTLGQSFPSHAHALVVLTTRFPRNFWKYREHRRSYTVLMMDAAHLSQTFYLVCAELGLGAFVTAFINSHVIEQHLALDGFKEGPIAVCGCGWPAPDPAGLDPEFRPYRPRG